jgi:hypothetical protein
MALRDILLSTAPVLTINLSDTGQRALLVARINRAARELYDSQDFAGTLREQVFTFAASAHQVALPWYVDQIRGVREYDAGDKVQINSMRPRYQTNAWTQDLLSWRVKGFSPLQCEITNATQLTLTFSEALTEPVDVIVTGATATASCYTETVSFDVGDTVKTTTKQFQSWPEFRSIRKSAATNADLTVTSATQTLAEIPNRELESRYTLVQILDKEFTTSSVVTDYEILYKMRFSPFVDDYDEFPCRGFDMAIHWKTLEHHFAERQDEGDRAVGCHEKCNEVLRQINANDAAGKEMFMDFGQNRFLDIVDSCC